MAPPVVLAAALLAISAGLVLGCGDDDGGGPADREPAPKNRRPFRVPNEGMEPTIAFKAVVELDTDPGQIGVGDVIVFHPPVGAELGTCAVRRPARQGCS